MFLKLLLLNKVSKKRIFGTARVLAYGMVVATAMSALTIHNAVADVHVQSLELGRKLADVQDLMQTTNEYRLNGQRIYFSSSTVDEPVGTVLDRFESHCNKSLAFDSWKSLAALQNSKNGSATPSSLTDHLGVMRTEDKKVGDGAVMCFTGDKGPQNVLKALQAFTESGDLHDIGDLRYVHAQRQGQQTSIQTVWTDGSFNLNAIIGKPGRDSIGSDFATLPRPVNSTRVMTAEAVGTQYAARIYESTSAPDVVLDSYVSTMVSRGWSAVGSPNAHFVDGTDGRVLLHPESGEQAVVSVSKSKDRTMVVVGASGKLTTNPREAARVGE